MREFHMAPMSAAIWGLTLFSLTIPVGMLVGVYLGYKLLLLPFYFIAGIYILIWLYFRPTRFVIMPRYIEVHWPLRRRQIDRSGIDAAQLLDTKTLKKNVGWCARVGAGGLWGGFGWLWTQNRGIVNMYISRTDSMVWIERRNNRPWLITPKHPQEFIAAITTDGQRHSR